MCRLKYVMERKVKQYQECGRKLTTLTERKLFHSFVYQLRAESEFARLFIKGLQRNYVPAPLDMGQSGTFLFISRDSDRINLPELLSYCNTSKTKLRVHLNELILFTLHK